MRYWGCILHKCFFYLVATTSKVKQKNAALTIKVLVCNIKTKKFYYDYKINTIILIKASGLRANLF